MTSWNPRANDLFLKALELPSDDERRKYLDDACAGDVTLRAEVEGLLEAGLRAGAFLDPPTRGPAVTAAEPPPRESSGTIIGPYKLIEQIGEGGMGTVWMAQQTEPVKRLVAVKLIKAGMDSKQVIARFEAERQALALMDHPNIAKVLDGGTTGYQPAAPARAEAESLAGAAGWGRPYFVMDLVKGVPITKYCDEHHLTPRQRLELFVPVCHAIQHAHQKGIIHRDLKPSNVLVALYDGKPVPKVIDFGVAKAAGQPLTEHTLVTGFGAIVGTLEYMSPEQAEINQLDIDTRSDIYSLGVLLYELLTGSPPFRRKELEKAGLLEMLRVIREDEPSKPSMKLSTAEGLPTLAANRGTEPAKLAKLVRGELDWIVMKALEKDRNRRYETANGFAQDVQRYLVDEAVLACPPSLGYRLRKFVRRNKGPVLAASVVALALVGGIIGTSWGMLNADAARTDAAHEAQQKATALTDAREQLFQALLNRARAERSSGRVGQHFGALKAIRDAAQIRVSPELRTEAIAALVLPDVEVVHEWEAWQKNTMNLDFDASFERYARLDTQGGITVCRRTDGPEEVLARRPARGKPNFSGPWMSPDGRFVAFGHSSPLGAIWTNELVVWALDGAARQEPFVVGDGMPITTLAYRLDRPHLAVGHPDGAVGVYDLERTPVQRRRKMEGSDALEEICDLERGTRVQRLEIGAYPHHIAFHPKEGRLAVATANGVRLFDVETGTPLPNLLWPAPAPGGLYVSWHPDGRRLAVAGADGRIRIWDSQTGEVMFVAMHSDSDAVASVAFNPAGDLLVSRGSSGRTRVYDVATGRVLLAPPNDFGHRFSQDGRLLGWSWDGVTKVRVWRLKSDRGLTALRRRHAVGAESLSSLVLHEDGRTVAAASPHALAFFDVVKGQELASVPWPRLDEWYPVFFDPASSPASGSPATGQQSGRDWKVGLPEEEKTGGWITARHAGMSIWPARWDPARPGTLRVGPPRRLLADAGTRGAAASRDGRVVAAPRGNTTVVLHRDRPERRLELGPQVDVRFAAVSPKGEWIVTGSHWWDGQSNSAWIWDAETGRRVHQLPVIGMTPAQFSPDGRWLVTNTPNDPRLWEVGGDWREVRPLKGHAIFSPDSRLMAVNDGVSKVRLEETATGREVACLIVPEPVMCMPACFTPDGTRLIIDGAASPAYVWDLRLIRAQLKTLKLDWDWPEFDPPAPASDAPPALRVEVITGEQSKRVNK